MTDAAVQRPPAPDRPLPSPPEAAPAAHFPAFDGFRGIAALAVLVTHVSFLTEANLMTGGSLLARLDAGVAVFFVISGFLLYRPFVGAALDRTPGPGLRRYALRRGARILPAYWVALTVIAVIWGTHPFRGREEAVLDYTLLHIYRVDYVVGGPISPAWTLATELSFYVFLPLFFALVGRRIGTVRGQLLVLGGLYGASVLFRIAVFALDPDRAGMYLTWLPANLDLFALGMGLAVVSAWSERHGEPGLLSSPALPVVAWGLAALSFAAVSFWAGLPTSTIEYSEGDQWVRQFLYGSTAFFFLLPGVFGPQDRGAVRGFLRNRIVHLLGLVSYGIYLWHEHWLERFLQWTDRPDFTGGFLPALVAVTALSVATAAVSYILVERPALRLGRSRPTR